jgi:hypothetical protein
MAERKRGVGQHLRVEIARMNENARNSLVVGCGVGELGTAVSTMTRGAL